MPGRGRWIAVTQPGPESRTYRGVEMNAKVMVFAVIGSLLLGGVGVAELYKWVDEKGSIHFSDRPPENMAAVGEVKSIPTRKYESPSPSPSASVGQDGSNSRDTSSQMVDKGTTRPTPEVELFTTSWCGYCGKARDFFRSRGISFREYDIERDENAAQRKRSLDPRRGVPFAVVNGQSIHGFAPAAYARALELSP